MRIKYIILALLASGTLVFAQNSGGPFGRPERDPYWKAASNAVFTAIAAAGNPLDADGRVATNNVNMGADYSLTNALDIGASTGTFDVIYVSGTKIDGTTNAVSVSLVDFDADFIPTVSGAYDIGSALLYVDNIYANTYYGDGSNLDGVGDAVKADYNIFTTSNKFVGDIVGTRLRNDTADGTDTGITKIQSGGGTSQSGIRGAELWLIGNEYGSASWQGDVSAILGSATDASFDVYGSGSPVFTVYKNGNVDGWANNLTNFAIIEADSFYTNGVPLAYLSSYTETDPFWIAQSTNNTMTTNFDQTVAFPSIILNGVLLDGTEGESDPVFTNWWYSGRNITNGTWYVWDNIEPGVSNAVNIGSPDKWFSNIYCNTGHFDSTTIYIGGVPLSSDGSKIIADIESESGDDYLTAPFGTNTTIQFLDYNGQMQMGYTYAYLTGSRGWIYNGLGALYEKDQQTVDWVDCILSTNSSGTVWESAGTPVSDNDIVNVTYLNSRNFLTVESDPIFAGASNLFAKIGSDNVFTASNVIEILRINDLLILDGNTILDADAFQDASGTTNWMNVGSQLLYDDAQVWRSEGIATQGIEIVNYDTMASREIYAEGWTTNGSITLTNQSTYYAWTDWTPGLYSTDDIGWTNNGIQVVSSAGAGRYHVIGNLSVSQNQNGEHLECALWKGADGVATQEIEKISGHTYMATSGEVYPIPLGGFIDLEQSDYLEIRFSNDTGAGRVISAVDGIINFRMIRIGD